MAGVYHQVTATGAQKVQTLSKSTKISSYPPKFRDTSLRLRKRSLRETGTDP